MSNRKWKQTKEWREVFALLKDSGVPHTVSHRSKHILIQLPSRTLTLSRGGGWDTGNVRSALRRELASR